MNEENFEMKKDIERNNQNVKIFAILDDLGGSKYFLQTENGSFLWLDKDLNTCEEVDEATVYASVVKHGYKITENQQEFSFGERNQILNKNN
ncbi:MAG: hypothetical protein AAB446_00570 [Patescibacteria group bacterium]